MTTAPTVLAEGKTKILRPGEGPDEVLVEYKNQATAFNAQKVAEVEGKGELNARISTILFELLAGEGLPTCFRRVGSRPNELVYQRLSMIPLEVVVRNDALGSLVKRFGIEEGSALKKPLVEFFYKSNDDPLITDDTIEALGLIPETTTPAAIRRLALKINEVLVPWFGLRGIRCADFKLEFGVDANGLLVLGDELSPDNFRLRDAETGQVLDKDVFRLDLGDVGETYKTLLGRMEQRVGGITASRETAYEAEVRVSSRKNILNPESKAILEGLHVLGHTDVEELRAGKRFVLRLTAESLADAEKQIERIAGDVLSNPVIEDFDFDLRQV